MEKKLNLIEKLIEIRRQVPYIQKNLNSHQYKYFAGSTLLGLLRPKMDELGILLSYSVEEMETVDVERQKKDKKTDKMVTFQIGRVKLKFVFTFTNAENPSEVVERTLWFQGIGDDIKDIGSYNTYALRYFLIGFFNIPSDKEDPDTFDKTVEQSQPVDLVSEEQVEKIKERINGHDDIATNILKAYKRYELIKAKDFDFVMSVIDKRIADKEAKK